MAAHNSISNTPGQRFGNLVLIEEAARSTHARKWLVRCDCGNEHIVWQQNLRSEKTTTCGACDGRARPTQHGFSHTPLYIVWQQMRARCYNKNAPNYRDYGGRGISVCDAWNRDFLPFYRWAISNGYAAGLSIDRRDNNGNYEPGNCRWTTSEVQNRNRRSVKINEDAARTIIAERKRGTPAKSLAQLFNINISHVYDIAAGRRWKGI